MRRFAKIRHWRFAACNIVLAVLTLSCVLLFQVIAGTLDSVRAAERWRGENEMRFAQVSCFLPEDGKTTVDAVESFRRTVEQELVNASLGASEDAAAQPGGPITTEPLSADLYVDAYSGTAKVNVHNAGTSATVKAIGVGGEFFLFHPLQLRSGSYLSENDLMHDRVVLDEELAWQLFGSTDVAGMDIMIGAEPFYVAGVVHREDDFASSAAYLDGAGMFISFAALQRLQSCGISCYEIVLPDPISGFGLSVVEKSFPVSGGDVVEVSTRYDLSSLFGIVKDFGHRSMRTGDVIYPYWENAARLTEDYLALLLVLTLLFGSCPVVSLVVCAIRGVVHGSRYLKKRIPEDLSKLSEAKKEKNYAKVGK